MISQYLKELDPMVQMIAHRMMTRGGSFIMTTGDIIRSFADVGMVNSPGKFKDLGWETTESKLYFCTVGSDVAATWVLIASAAGIIEDAQDQVGGILTDSTTINLTYNDNVPSIVADVIYQMSIAADGDGLKLSGDSASPGNNKVYGTNGEGTKGWYDKGILPWNETVGATDMLVNKGYVTNNVSQVALTLPTTAAFGDQIGVTGKGAGGWRILQNAGQTIHCGYLSSLTGATGYIESIHFLDGVVLLCITPNTDWKVVWSSGSLNVKDS